MLLGLLNFVEFGSFFFFKAKKTNKQLFSFLIILLFLATKITDVADKIWVEAGRGSYLALYPMTGEDSRPTEVQRA